MNVKRLLQFLGIAVVLTDIANAQGFAELGQDSAGFALPDPTERIIFPRDHGPHKDFRTEWWYVTANLIAGDGSVIGVQWTLFRSKRRPEGEDLGWNSPHAWMGHAAVTTENSHSFAEVFARGGIGQAGVKTGPFEAWIDDWTATGTPDGIDRLTLKANGEGFAYSLVLVATTPPVLHGADGFSVKSSAGNASHYYSQPNYEATGTITLQDQNHEVTGTAWYDHEWSSQALAPDQEGWDWFALSLETGERVMLAQVRGSRENYLFGSWIEDGKLTTLPAGSFSLVPEDPNASPPTAWRIEIPSKGVFLEGAALNESARTGNLFPYFEGPIRLEGSHAGTGYLEMTGYR